MFAVEAATGRVADVLAAGTGVEAELEDALEAVARAEDSRGCGAPFVAAGALVVIQRVADAGITGVLHQLDGRRGGTRVFLAVTTRRAAGIVVLVLFDLLVNHLLAHGSCLIIFARPQVHVGQHGPDGFLGDTVATAIILVVCVVRITQDGILLGFEAILDDVLKHLVEGRNADISHGMFLIDGIAGEGNIPEGADEVEVTQRADGFHLGDGGADVRIGRVFLGHFRCTFDDDVTFVDHGIEAGPVGIAVRSQQVLAFYVIDIALVDGVQA